MAEDKNLVLKTQEFSGFLKQLRATLGDKTTMQKVVDSEVSKVLEKAVALTGKADRSKIEKRVEARAVFNIEGKKYVTRNWKTGQPWRVPNAVWSQIQSLRKQSLTRRLAAIGLSKQSFYLLAKRLGYEIAAPGFVKAAKAKSGDTDRDVSIRRDATPDKYGVTITNAMPILRYDPPSGTQAFFSALSGRIGFYKKNLAMGVFDSVSRTAAKYKGVIVKPR